MQTTPKPGSVLRARAHTIASLRGELGRLTEANQALTRQVAQQQVDVDNAQLQSNLAAQQLRQAQEGQERAAAAARAELDRVKEQWQGNETRWLGEIDRQRDELKRQRSDHERVQKGLQGRLQELEEQVSAGAKERASLRVSIDSAQRELASEREKRSFAEGALAAAREHEKGTPAPGRRQRRPVRNAR